MEAAALPLLASPGPGTARAKDMARGMAVASSRAKGEARRGGQE